MSDLSHLSVKSKFDPKDMVMCLAVFSAHTNTNRSFGTWALAVLKSLFCHSGAGLPTEVHKKEISSRIV